MRVRDVLSVGFVGVVSFGAAALFRLGDKPEGFRFPAWVPMVGDSLVDWDPDLRIREYDRRQLMGELARAPAVWEPPHAPDIVVIVLDTVRADRLGMYGYDGETTPHLDKFAKDARVYDQMVSDGAWTLPSHASLFTGKPVIAHGAHGTPLGGDLAAPLAEGVPTLARQFREAGYRTVGIAANQAFLNRLWGLSQGFDVWLCDSLMPDRMHLPYVTADRVTALAEAALKRPRDAPMFLFLNYMDAHAPWIPRRGYVSEPDAIHRDLLPYSKGWDRITEDLMADGTPSPEGQRAWSEAYDSELRFLDEHVGQLLEELPQLGIGPNDYVFVLSDHGEYLGEHNLVEHSKDVYEPVLRVPLLIHGPGYEPGRDATPIQTHDVTSLIAAAGKVTPPEGAARTEGLQVSELYWSRHRDLKNPRYGKRFDRIRRAFRIGAQKLILGSDGSKEAYDLLTDPGELTAVMDAPWVPQLEAAAAAWLAAHPEGERAAMGGEGNTAALKALGYVE